METPRSHAPGLPGMLAQELCRVLQAAQGQLTHMPQVGELRFSD
jgi:hypothetical protein